MNTALTMLSVYVSFDVTTCTKLLCGLHQELHQGTSKPKGSGEERPEAILGTFLSQA